MKLRVATFSVILVLAGSLTFSQLLNKRPPQTEVQVEDLSDKVSRLKREAKENLEPFRYDGAKVTYFLYKPYLQRKEVEVYFFDDTEYKLAFNSNAVKDAIELSIWDDEADSKYRTKLYEKKNVAGGEFTVTSTELLDALKSAKIAKGMSEAEAEELRLKKVYVNYIIPNKSREYSEDEDGNRTIVRTKAAMVMAMGYSNI